MELGISFGIGDVTIAGALQTTADDTAQGSAGNDEDIIGVAVSGINFGPVGLVFGAQMQDDDQSLLAQVDINSFYYHLEMLSVDATDQDRMSHTFGYTMGLGRKTTMYFELNSIDNDTGDSDDDRTAVMAVLKYDII